ncbi:hypothetical protein SRB5_05370 [Streptomyces sp. RB5]|uniref:DUF742 domain-containing protein n=1 Tax=Streptomyces smaragdinus TaxID=2585196 RepID=A0A7K0CAF9_9ACTN|nr:DUF742 domain-containing protein [Streptomyces smaragdinus]MQY10429.1 hypothetical protein [Streptomyces smaragdinus]
MSDEDHAWHEAGPERLYVITGGRSGEAAKEPLDLVTLVIARSGPPHGMQPEQAAILRLCTAPISVAEIAAYLGLPFSVVSVLLGDLLAEELVVTRSTVPPVADMGLIKEVIRGLEQL